MTSTCNFLSLFKPIKVFPSIYYRKLFYNACIETSINTSKCNEDRINKSQIYAERIILYAPFDSPSQPLFEKLEWPNIFERIE